MSVGQIQQIELLQWSFIRKMQGVSLPNYWEALDKLNIYSLQGRRNRYLIIYIWKVLEGIVKNISNKIKSYQSVSHRRKCIIPQNKNLTGRLKTIRESTAPMDQSYSTSYRVLFTISQLSVWSFSRDPLINAFRMFQMNPKYRGIQHAGEPTQTLLLICF